MTQFQITYSAKMPEGAVGAIVPAGAVTPQGATTQMTVQDGTVTELAEAGTAQRALHVVPQGARLQVTYQFDDTQGAPYADAMFAPRPSRYTRYADALAAEARNMAGDLTGLARATAIAAAAAERFTYGHPVARFNDGLDAVPALGCGMTEGSCVDINTYFLAALRAAGIEAGYVTGFFFPAEKRDHCVDGHCWVVTRIDGQCHEWDIAHHLKLGTREIAPGLNPKPGFRAACFHSMGLDFPQIGITGIKAMTEPMAIANGAAIKFDRPEVRLHHPNLPARVPS